jgi:hypothetical protein
MSLYEFRIEAIFAGSVKNNLDEIEPDCGIESGSWIGRLKMVLFQSLFCCILGLFCSAL